MAELWMETGLANMTPGQLTMIGVGLTLIYLAIAKGFEPLLLLPIGFGGILANIPEAGLADPNGFLGILAEMGLKNGLRGGFGFCEQATMPSRAAGGSSDSQTTRSVSATTALLRP